MAQQEIRESPAGFLARIGCAVGSVLVGAPILHNGREIERGRRVQITAVGDSMVLGHRVHDDGTVASPEAALTFCARDWEPVGPGSLDRGRELANALVPADHLGLSHGEGALGLAFASIARDAIEDVYADCGDTDAAVLSSNVGGRIAHFVHKALFEDATPTGAKR